MHGRLRQGVPLGSPDPSPKQPSPSDGGVARPRENDTTAKMRAGKFREALEGVVVEMMEEEKAPQSPKAGPEKKGSHKKTKVGPKRKGKEARKSRTPAESEDSEESKKRSTRSTLRSARSSRSASTKARSLSRVGRGQLTVDDFYPKVQPAGSGGQDLEHADHVPRSGR